MAKFKYRMQNILNVKQKLETQAKNEFATARLKLDEEEDKLRALQDRKKGYEDEGRQMRQSTLNLQDLSDNEYAIHRMEEYIIVQIDAVKKAEKELDRAREKLTKAMQETQIHEKLREKAFEEFKKELNAQEAKEIDELTSYTYGQKKDE